jgi:hypothetical protein
MDTVTRLPDAGILLTSELVTAIADAQTHGFIAAIAPTIYSSTEYTCNAFFKYREEEWVLMRFFGPLRSRSYWVTQCEFAGKLKGQQVENLNLLLIEITKNLQRGG